MITQFVSYLAETLRAHHDAVLQLDSLHVDDLYLACACAAHDREALAAFADGFMPQVNMALARVGCPVAAFDDVKQIIWEKLFVGGGSGRKKILAYMGRGPLSTWLRAVAARAGLDLLRTTKQEDPVDDELLIELASPSADPALAHMKQLYRSAYNEAIRHALKSLTVKERNFLRQYFF